MLRGRLKESSFLTRLETNILLCCPPSGTSASVGIKFNRRHTNSSFLGSTPLRKKRDGAHARIHSNRQTVTIDVSQEMQAITVCVLLCLMMIAPSQGLTCICTCGSSTYYPSASCSSSSNCASICYSSYGSCYSYNTQGCCGGSCAYYSSSSSYAASSVALVLSALYGLSKHQY